MRNDRHKGIHQQRVEVVSDDFFAALDRAVSQAERIPDAEYAALDRALRAAESQAKRPKVAASSHQPQAADHSRQNHFGSNDFNSGRASGAMGARAPGLLEPAQQRNQFQERAMITPSDRQKIQDCYNRNPQPSTSLSQQPGDGSRTVWNRADHQQVRQVSLSLRMIGNGERFGIFFVNGDQSALDATLRKKEGCTWDNENRVWSFCVLKHDHIVDFLKNSVPQVQCKVEEVHPFALRLMRSALGRRRTDKQVQEVFEGIPQHLRGKLMGFQTEGVRYMIRLNGRGLIGDEMGLGKTVQALALVEAFREAKPVLIVTPSSLKIQWAEAIYEWLRVTEDEVSIVNTGKDTTSLKNRFVIISYDFIPKMFHYLKERNFQMIICDEAHYIKNYKAKRSKESLPLLQQAKHVVLLTGTPALSRPIELLQQLRAIHPQSVKSIKEYGDRYCTGGAWFAQKYPGARYMGASNLKELHQVVTSTTMIRRLKKDVLSQLPPKRRQQILLPVTSAEQRQLKGMTEKLFELETALKDGTGSGALFSGDFGKNQKINELYLKSGEIKCKAICDYLSVLLEAEQKFLVFGHHKCVLDSIESHLREKRVKFIRIDGSTPSNSRAELVQKFQENDVYRAAILSIKAAGVGLTLTAASLVVMAELDWVPGNLVQAEDRAHRIGQASSVNVHYLHMKGSIDDIIWAALKNKLGNIGTLLDGKESKMNLNEKPGTQRSSGSDKSGTQKTMDSFVVKAPNPRK
ncbi:P-loop-containing nucleoside triphosphate hydrolase [Chloropicon primus]|uniref:P-loop-containing nucleoside triphosphate hydrolase n=1 Tax=Chloropicon primus TaxID=1764295 RepID=A0A5B8MQV6_9CHLO|nr:P-loop-containing nucleoside triphosphate hydrolase [Chloropicon primus]UPR00972.1 P-loop-containing nucleoside triphosphate hydrolase [Chloropicon primus]|mmetsp:Transcript_12225/g.33936  ORF Transcript_12225/g.33936 Transcript_12225/m.33936 type:complete len:745 (-) Transcript_12225:2850-5084(-)|eukprot:QDZ21750.1 P-loop-containing nucleoside triphosphate hydrolase [Chloropicon primus]